MDQLWAPWRLSYVTIPKKQSPTDEKGTDCFVCRAVASQEDRENLVLFRSPLSIVILNRFPYNNGHLLVCPQRHAANLKELTSEELLDLQLILRKMTSILERRMNPDGFNIGLNLGHAAGAGLPGHLHWHIVPRWSGDTNFMPVLTDTRVIVQSLEALHEILSQELRNEKTG